MWSEGSASIIVHHISFSHFRKNRFTTLFLPGSYILKWLATCRLDTMEHPRLCWLGRTMTLLSPSGACWASSQRYWRETHSWLYVILMGPTCNISSNQMSTNSRSSQNYWTLLLMISDHLKTYVAVLYSLLIEKNPLSVSSYTHWRRKYDTSLPDTTLRLNGAPSRT